jgi:shikimate kinase
LSSPASDGLSSSLSATGQVANSPGLPDHLARGLIFLIGARGAGKTTVARLLAERLGWRWLDADEEIERRSDKTIREIFAAAGEAGFRRLESGLLAELCQSPFQVIATGGGVVLKETNRALLRSAGRVVWLTADARTLWGRLQADPATPGRRPPLAGGGLPEVEQVLQARESLYRECADWVVSTVNRSPAETAAEIIAHLQTSSCSP